MQLTTEELFALREIFRDVNATSTAIGSQLDQAQAIDRKKTGVGFFTTIRLAMPLQEISQQQWEWNFEHRRLSHGGSFMCWLENAYTLELEAVSHNGNWPEHFNPNDFRARG